MSRAKNMNSAVFLGDLVSEFARGFRHISAITATSCLGALMGVVAKLALTGTAATIFSSTFFGIAAVPLAALVVRQSIYLFRQVSDPHEERNAAPTVASAPIAADEDDIWRELEEGQEDALQLSAPNEPSLNADGSVLSKKEINDLLGDKTI